MRLIDADALLKEVENEQKYLIARGQLSEEHLLVHSLKRPVLDAPTVDAVERKKGKWVGGQCSECGGDVPAYIIDWRWQKDMDAKFCPMCGAEMETDEPSNLEDSRQ